MLQRIEIGCYFVEKNILNGHSFAKHIRCSLCESSFRKKRRTKPGGFALLQVPRTGLEPAHHC